MDEKHIKHVRILKHHKNSLYIIVFVLLAFEVIAFISVSAQIYKIDSQQKIILRDLDSLENDADSTRQESRFGINSLAQELAQQKKDVQGEITLLKITQSDFSEVIGNVTNGVVSISTDVSGASGFLISNDGYIVTNNHVIEDASTISASTYDGNYYSARIIGSDSAIDLALLKIEGSFQKIELADSDQVQVGQEVIAIGNPLGLSFSVTRGIVSGVHRTGPNNLQIYVQTDVTLNRGNSGGPLINKEGKVIGMNNFKVGDAEALGFALESNTIKEKIIEIATQNVVQLSV